MGLEKYYEDTAYLNKKEGNIKIKFENSEDTIDLGQKDNGLFIIIKKNYKKILDAYKSTISLIKDISSKEDLTKKVYLIPTNSIPKFIAILTDFNALNPNTKLTEDKKIEIEKAFFKYNLEKNIEIISEYEKLQDIINDEEDNEFIIVDIKFLTGMEIEEYYEKTVYLNKTEGNIQIKFENTENNYYLKQKDNGLFELIKNDNYTNDLSEIVSFFDCFTRIKKLTDYLNDNCNSLFPDDSNKPYSLFFCSFIATKNLENNIRDSFEEMQLNEPLSLIDTFYDKMHEELNQKENKMEVNSYESD